MGTTLTFNTLTDARSCESDVQMSQKITPDFVCCRVWADNTANRTATVWVWWVVSRTAAAMFSHVFRTQLDAHPQRNDVITRQWHHRHNALHGAAQPSFQEPANRQCRQVIRKQLPTAYLLLLVIEIKYSQTKNTGYGSWFFEKNKEKIETGVCQFWSWSLKCGSLFQPSFVFLCQVLEICTDLKCLLNSAAAQTSVRTAVLVLTKTNSLQNRNWRACSSPLLAN